MKVENMWQELYKFAVLETDDKLLQKRIQLGAGDRPRA
jgi:hypothetical protein